MTAGTELSERLNRAVAEATVFGDLIPLSKVVREIYDTDWFAADLVCGLIRQFFPLEDPLGGTDV